MSTLGMEIILGEQQIGVAKRQMQICVNPANLEDLSKDIHPTAYSSLCRTGDHCKREASSNVMPENFVEYSTSFPNTVN